MNVLLAFDDSPQSHAAASLLQTIQFPSRSTLYLLYVVETDKWAEGVEGKSMIHMRTVLAKAKSKETTKVWRFMNKLSETFSKPRMRVKPLISDGIPGGEILAAIEKYHIDLVVLGTRGRKGLKRFFLGSVSEWVLTEAPCSVLVVRKESEAWLKRSKGLKILMGTDGSPDAKFATEFIRQLTFPPSSNMMVCHVLEAQNAMETELSARLGVTGISELEKLRKELLQVREQQGDTLLNASVSRLRRRGLIVGHSLTYGHPADRLLTLAQRQKVDLVVVGSRGMTGLRRFFLGSVSHKLVRHAPSSVLVVRKPRAGNKTNPKKKN